MRLEHQAKSQCPTSWYGVAELLSVSKGTDGLYEHNDVSWCMLKRDQATLLENTRRNWNEL